MRSAHDVIISPLQTEKALMGVEERNYAFLVARDATKIEIRQAVESIFGVQVQRVNTMRQLGKIKRRGRTQGRRPETKKAYVKLTAGSKGIEFFEGMA